MGPVRSGRNGTVPDHQENRDKNQKTAGIAPDREIFMPPYIRDHPGHHRFQGSRDGGPGGFQVFKPGIVNNIGDIGA